VFGHVTALVQSAYHTKFGTVSVDRNLTCKQIEDGLRVCGHVYRLSVDLVKMLAPNVRSNGGELCLTMVELALAQSSLRGCGSGRADGVPEIAGDGFRDEPHAYSGCGDGQVLDLDIHEVRGKYDLGHTPSVTHSLPYVSQQHAAPSSTAFGQNFRKTSSLLDFDLDCLSAVERDPKLSEARSKDPPATLAVSNSGDYLPLGCVGAMPSSEVRAARPSHKVAEGGQRKKAVPRRHSQPAGTQPDTVLPPPLIDPCTEKLMDDFARLADYVPDCLERFGFCVVDKFAGKSLASSVRSEVLALYERGSFEGGLLTSQAFALTAVRGDRVFWLEREDDGQCTAICKLIRRLDDLFLRLRGCLGTCHISSRSKVSCVEGCRMFFLDLCSLDIPHMWLLLPKCKKLLTHNPD